MPSVRAQLVAAFSPNMVLALIACAAIAALWAGFRPDMVRDNDGRRLPPSLTARATFVLLFVTGYLALTAGFHFVPYLVKSVPHSVFQSLISSFEISNAPVYALLTSFGLYSLTPFREVERNLLTWMHSTRHLRGDARLLAQHLQGCGFAITPVDEQRNREFLARFEVYITGDDTKRINLPSVTAWRKTSSLLRHLLEWSAEEPRLLTQDERKLAEELEKAHGRKTRLAMDIIRMLERMREGGDPVHALSVTELLSQAPHSDRREVAKLEQAAQARLESAPGAASDRPVRLTTNELQEYLRKIEGYFQVEYRLMLEQVAELAAKSVVRAGDKAAERLEELKAAGFPGLGKIEPISASRIIWFLVSVSLGVFLLYYVFWYPTQLERWRSQGLSDLVVGTRGRAALISVAIFAGIMALTSLVAALFGSSSTHARAKETPWGTYVVAGLIAAVVFFLMQGVREVILLSIPAPAASITTASTTASPEASTSQGATVGADPSRSAASSETMERMKNVAPWFVLPFLTAIGICRLARRPPWKSRFGIATAGFERFSDGLLLGLTLIPGYAVAIGLREISGLGIPANFTHRYDPLVLGLLFVLGFFVGALVVRDIRSAAHARVVAEQDDTIAPGAIAYRHT